MNKIQVKTKREYITPGIEKIILDYEISLAMESDAPVGPGEGKLKEPEYFKNDPYNTNMA
mgnify:CR=1 FL=1